LRAASVNTSSSKELKVPQAEHLPNHCEDSAPHSLHLYTDLVFGIPIKTCKKLLTISNT